MSQNVHQKFTEEQNKVRLFIINITVSEKRPYHLDMDKEKAMEVLEITSAEYEECIEALLGKDGMVIDEKREVNFIYPVSALETGHQVTLADGRTFSAMCAIDALGAAYTFHQDTEVHSACAVCGEPVHVVIRDGQIKEYTPRTVHALTFPLGELENWAGSC